MKHHKTDIVNVIGAIAFALIGLAMCLLVINVAIERNRSYTCLKLAHEALDYPLFFYSESQATMCGVPYHPTRDTLQINNID